MVENPGENRDRKTAQPCVKKWFFKERDHGGHMRLKAVQPEGFEGDNLEG